MNPSELIAELIESVENGTPTPAPPSRHAARRYGDQYQCHRCGKAWDVDDNDPPPCVHKKAPSLRGR